MAERSLIKSNVTNCLILPRRIRLMHAATGSMFLNDHIDMRANILVSHRQPLKKQKGLHNWFV